MKLIIDIPEEVYKASKIVDARYEYTVPLPFEIIKNGIPLDKVKTEFIKSYPTNYAGVPEFGGMFCHFSLCQVLEILDNIDKESEE